MNHIVIKLAKNSDVEMLLPLFEEYRAFYGKEPNKIGSYKFLKERITNTESQIYLAYISNELAGFVQLYKSFSSTRLSILWILNDLYTREKFRGKKVGAKLIEMSKSLVRESGACGMMLETAKDNRPGNYLYPKEGFKLMDGVNHYFWANDSRKL